MVFFLLLNVVTSHYPHLLLKMYFMSENFSTKYFLLKLREHYERISLILRCNQDWRTWWYHKSVNIDSNFLHTVIRTTTTLPLITDFYLVWGPGCSRWPSSRIWENELEGNVVLLKKDPTMSSRTRNPSIKGPNFYSGDDKTPTHSDLSNSL